MNRRDFIKASLACAAYIPLSPLCANTAAPVPPVGTPITRRPYKDTDTTFPMLGFGMMRLPKCSPDKPDLDNARIKALFDRALAAGVNYFDTAYFYHGGLSEKAVGEVLSQYPRDSYLLADKMPVSHLKTEADIARIWEEQLSKTQAGYFDVYLLHALNRNNWKKAQELRVYEFLKQKQAEGKIRKLGFSFHDAPEILEAIASAKPWDIALIQINYLDWTGYKSKEQYDILTKYNIPVLVMEPLRGGRLANLPKAAADVLTNSNAAVSQASWAFRYVGSLPNVLCILSGMSSIEHLEDNIKTFTNFQPLTEPERKVLETARALYLNADLIPCTDCKYCIPCAAEVNIADIFSLYNRHKGQKAAFQAAYKRLPEETQATSCVECDACIKKCPQKLNIPHLLKQLRAEMEV